MPNLAISYVFLAGLIIPFFRASSKTALFRLKNPLGISLLPIIARYDRSVFIGFRVFANR